MTKEWAEDELVQAAQDMYDRAWLNEEEAYRPKRENWVRGVLENRVAGLSNENTLNMQCELNELRRQAVILMTNAAHICRTNSWPENQKLFLDFIEQNKR